MRAKWCDSYDKVVGLVSNIGVIISIQSFSHRDLTTVKLLPGFSFNDQYYCATKVLGTVSIPVKF